MLQILQVQVYAPMEFLAIEAKTSGLQRTGERKATHAWDSKDGSLRQVASAATPVARVTGRHILTKEFNQYARYRLKFCLTCRIKFPHQWNFLEHLKSKKHKNKEARAKAGPALPRRRAPLRCELCAVTCNGPGPFVAHIRGAKHQKALIPDLVGRKYMEAIKEWKDVAHSKVVGYKCHLCDCRVSFRSVQMHMTGRRHTHDEAVQEILDTVHDPQLEELEAELRAMECSEEMELGQEEELILEQAERFLYGFNRRTDKKAKHML
ncbi:zinc finger protein 346-like [Hyalella azteca]|uniref:Zinc finger protein 346-like n=1 Tax=Hyalella azteca TaxID=294128 RepID=A0A979FQJ8_HYAAZ|nr:zinc finger protein 346-like [Hyalella azteca]